MEALIIILEVTRKFQETFFVLDLDVARRGAKCCTKKITVFSPTFIGTSNFCNKNRSFFVFYCCFVNLIYNPIIQILFRHGKFFGIKKMIAVKKFGKLKKETFFKKSFFCPNLFSKTQKPNLLLSTFLLFMKQIGSY